MPAGQLWEGFPIDYARLKGYDELARLEYPDNEYRNHQALLFGKAGEPE
jgi:hypothetical protein